MFIVETGDQNVGWVGGKILDILLSCNTRTGFSDRNSGPKLCAVSIANDGTLVSPSADLRGTVVSYWRNMCTKYWLTA